VPEQRFEDCRRVAVALVPALDRCHHDVAVTGDRSSRVAGEQMVGHHSDDCAVLVCDVDLSVEFAARRVLAPRPQITNDLGHFGQVWRRRLTEVEALEGGRVGGYSRAEDHVTTLTERFALPLGSHGSSPETSGFVRR
jgi:hypothetical protein